MYGTSEQLRLDRVELGRQRRMYMRQGSGTSTFPHAEAFFPGITFLYGEKRVVNTQQHLADALPVILLVRGVGTGKGRCENGVGDRDSSTALKGAEENSKKKEIEKEKKKKKKEKVVTDRLSKVDSPIATTSQTSMDTAKRTTTTQSDSAVLGQTQTLPSSNSLTVGTREVLKSLSSTVDTEECFLFLPYETYKSVSATVLSNDEEPNHLRIVLTPNPQDIYTWNNPLSRQSATVISRPIESIEEYKVPYYGYSIAYRAGEFIRIPEASLKR
ncbi:hypothetical protein P171DRAFT_438827 [Karstenula rhodostoma CBS 690.94]|uniref:Uncharacterized protein n=1 Tax=Karstenula rhodostoma CBS 690.94 TaxID=1392251 RepID=A0A9P4Q0F3_9PLEO|nr:hypothetical protein P171DRAFT_438827 [Karstenula rhodostoma CBS 690.94]